MSALSMFFLGVSFGAGIMVLAVALLRGSDKYGDHDTK